MKFSLEMANDLYGLAQMSNSSENKKELKSHINKCKKYLEKESVNGKI